MTKIDIAYSTRCAVCTISVLWLNTVIAAATNDRPNILFAFADDSGRYAGAYAAIEPGGPSDLIQTPNVDRITREGVLFTKAFVNAPSCTPCRSSLLSGQYFWRTRLGAILQGPSGTKQSLPTLSFFNRPDTISDTPTRSGVPVAPQTHHTDPRLPVTKQQEYGSISLLPERIINKRQNSCYRKKSFTICGSIGIRSAMWPTAGMRML
ncbi:MAG: sulfatase-like hydrolase/transferase [Fuerstiella sp.]|nr:sulfatase-like hydrolase/transferase [Fuerstiella sp.]